MDKAKQKRKAELNTLAKAMTCHTVTLESIKLHR